MEGEEYLADFYKNLDLKYDFRNKNLIRLIISKINKKKILEIGCGGGFLLNALDKKIKGENKELFGIEPNKKSAEFAKKNNPKIKIFNVNLENIEKTEIEKGLESIILIDVLEYTKDDKIAIELINKYLKQKAQLILVLPAHEFLYGKRDIQVGNLRRYSKKQAVQLLEKRGFKIKQIRYWNMFGFFPYLFFEKVLKKELQINMRIKKQKKLLLMFKN